MTAADTAADTRVERVDWRTFLARRFRWNQGEHMTLIGQTESGKTTTALRLLPFRRYVVALGTKPRDEKLADLIHRDGYHRTTEWPPPPLRERIVLWPHIDQIEDIPAMRDVFSHALGDIYARGGWTVYVDELHFVAKDLGLSQTLDVLWMQGRSLGVSLVAGFQRPWNVNQAAMDQTTHLLLWRTPESRDRKRVAELAGDRADDVRAELSQLAQHDVLYVNTRTGDALVTRPPNPDKE